MHSRILTTILIFSPQCEHSIPNFLTNLSQIPSSEQGFLLTKNSQKNNFKHNLVSMIFLLRSPTQMESSQAPRIWKWDEANGFHFSTKHEGWNVWRRGSLVIDAFRDAVQMPLRKESRFRRSPLVVGWFCLVLEHAAGGCRRRLQERRTLKLVEARRVESKGGVQAGLRPCGVPRSIQLGNWTGELAETGGIWFS